MAQWEGEACVAPTGGMRGGNGVIRVGFWVALGRDGGILWGGGAEAGGFR